MIFKVHDRVQHKHYPGTQGSVVALYGPVVLVLWDKKREPWNVSNSPDLPSRISRHIPGALDQAKCA